MKEGICYKTGKKIKLKTIYWPADTWEKTEQYPLKLSSRKLLAEEDKQTEDKPSEETAEKNAKILILY